MVSFQPYPSLSFFDCTSFTSLYPSFCHPNLTFPPKLRLNLLNLHLFYICKQNPSHFSTVLIANNWHSMVYTYYRCTSLEKIIFGTGLKTGGVFWDSKYIKEIHCRSTIPPSIIGFNNEVYNNATLYVPKGCNEAYHTAIMWREFKTIVEE